MLTGRLRRCKDNRGLKKRPLKGGPNQGRVKTSIVIVAYHHRQIEPPVKRKIKFFEDFFHREVKMATKQRKKQTGHFARYHNKPDVGCRWTAAARWLFDEVHNYGPKGCYKSNRTLARESEFTRRTIQLARKWLVEHQVILTARTLPRTWSMWNPRPETAFTPAETAKKGGGSRVRARESGAKIAPQRRKNCA